MAPLAATRPALRRVILVPTSANASSSRLTTRTLIRQLTTTRSTSSTSTSSRPQLPFLTVPTSASSRPPPSRRFLTTETRRWLAFEVYRGTKWTLQLWGIVACATAVFYVVALERAEREHPSPEDWSFGVRSLFRVAHREVEKTRQGVPERWAYAGRNLRAALAKLEDPGADGEGLVRLSDAVGADDVGGVFDVSAKSEPWRRGYHDVLMSLALAAEHLDGWVHDRRRDLYFPGETVLGPSNPRPKPVRPGSPAAPREEDCETFFPSAAHFYDKILATRGFTERQYVDAALGRAAWEEFSATKGSPEGLAAADEAYRKAVQIASAEQSMKELYDGTTYALAEPGRRRQSNSTATITPSDNLLRALTALGEYRARTGDIASAMPILLSVLRARRSLARPSPEKQTPPPKKKTEGGKAPVIDLRDFLGPLLAFAQSKSEYPPAPSDGREPPVRDSLGLCREAALDVYIGEMMYATATAAGSDGPGREEGVAWTREGVDVAEEQLHSLGPPDEKEVGLDDRAEARRTCRECLATGLANWRLMAAELAAEERTREEERGRQAGKGGWLGMWSGATGGGAAERKEGRWEAETRVLGERARRAAEVLEDKPKDAGFKLTSLLIA